MSLVTVPPQSAVCTAPSELTPPSSFSDIFKKYGEELQALPGDSVELQEIFTNYRKLFEKAIEGIRIWEAMHVDLIEYTERRLQNSHKDEKNNPLYAQAEICRDLLKTLCAKFEKESVHVFDLRDIKKYFETWIPWLLHVKTRLSLSPELQQKINRISVRNLLLKNANNSYLSEYQARLELLFPGRFTPIIFLGKGSVKKSYAVLEVTTHKVYSVSIACLQKFNRMAPSALEGYNRYEKEVSLKLSGASGIMTTLEVQELKYEQQVLQGFVQELMDGEFFEITKKLYDGKEISSVTPAILQKITLEILSSLAVLEENGIVHKDIRPENYFYRTNEDGVTVRLGDFGCCQPSGVEGREWSLKLTAKAPEFINDPSYTSHKMDVYAVGYLLYIMYFTKLLSMKTDHSKRVEYAALTKILNPTTRKEHMHGASNSQWFPNHPLEESDKGTIFEIIWHMLQFDEKARYTGSQALEAAKKVYQQTPLGEIKSAAV